MRAVNTAALLAPRSISLNSFRAEGAFWGVWRSFYAGYRFPIDSGSIHDDVEIVRALIEGGHECRNAAQAFVYKIPAGSLDDLCSATLRSGQAEPGHKRRRYEYLAATMEALRDPVGAVLYVVARLWCRTHRDRLLRGISDKWRVSDTTKRRPN